MRASYRPLFSVSIHHQYYRNGRPTDVSLHPTTATQALCQDQGLIIKQMQAGVVVLMKERATAPKFGKSAMISLFVQVKSPYFLNFTNIMQLKLEEKLVFNNLRTSSSVLGDSYVFHLNEKEEIDKSYHYNSCSMVKLLARYRQASHVVVVDDYDDVVFDGAGSELIDLAPASFEGRSLKWTVDDAPAIHYFVTDSDTTLKHPALINIYLSPEGTPIEGAPEYTLSFKSRPVTWVYKFVGAPNRACKGITIQKGRKTLPFSEIVETEEFRGKKALVVESQETYEMLERQDDPLTAQLELVDLDTKKTTLVEKRLTYPNVDTIQTYDDGKSIITKSETYIYF